MRRAIFVLVFLLATGGVAWAGTEAYKLVMSKDKELCASILQLFNTDMKQHKEIRYDKHEVFAQISWKGGLEEGSHGCSYLRHALFDINNDGMDELVIKTSHCLRDQLADSLYIFPSGSKVLEAIKEPGSQALATATGKVELMGKGGFWYELKRLSKGKKGELTPGIGGVLVLQPLLKGKTAYISMTDLHQEWIVIAKYKQADTLEDICYFHGKSLIAQ
jgi:hypothetical protein